MSRGAGRSTCGQHVARGGLPCKPMLRGTMAAAAAAAIALAPRPAVAEDDPWFGADKALHFTAGFGLSAAGYGVGVLGFDDRVAASGLGLSLAIGLGAGKEGLDAMGLGQPSWKDFTWTVAGALLGLGASLTFDAALRGPRR